MTTDQITGLLRAILSAIGGFVLAKGWLSAENWAWITGGLLTVGPVIWTWIANRPAAIAVAAQNITGVNVTTTAAAPAGVAAAVEAAKG